MCFQGRLGNVPGTSWGRPKTASQGRPLDARLGRPQDVISGCPKDFTWGRLWDGQIRSLGTSW